MKKLSNLVATLIAAFVLFQSCSENDPGSVQRSSSKIAFAVDEKIESSAIADYDLILTVEDLNGRAILLDRKISFSNTDGSFTTEDLNLPQGTYVITDLHLEKDEEIIFDAAASEAGSEASGIAALSHRFTLSGAETCLFFRMKPAKAKRKFRMAALIEGENGLQYTSATAYLKDGDNTVATYPLAARTNILAFNLDHKKEYTLIVSKDGYNDVMQPFIYKNIKHKPVRVRLVPVSNVVTMKGQTQPLNGDNSFQFQVWARPGAAITADFGSFGSMTVFYDDVSYHHSFELLNSEPQEYTVALTGDLDMVTEFAQDHGGLISEINVSGFTNVEQMHLAFHPLTSLDFSANKNLRFLYAYGMPTLADITLPVDHFINDFSISGNTGLSAAEVDAAIDNIYTNAINKNITNGQISISTEFYGGFEMLGPPSAASMAKLTELRDEHGWYIWPEF